VSQHLLDFLEDNPTAYLDEMRQFLYDEYELEASIATINRTLKRAKWSRKAVQARAAERSEPLRRAWQGIQKQYDSDQLIFLDESASSERTGDRKYGWSPLNLICEQSRPLKRSERWSILPALAEDGYLDWTIFQGSITAVLFLEFVRDRVLPHCSAYPGPRSVLILDNASIHKSAELRCMCEEKGVLLKFLPPYSPDFNPIENTFKDLKAWIRKNHVLAADFDDFGDFLEFAVGQCKGSNARQHFRHAGYIVN
jgi:transposase